MLIMTGTAVIAQTNVANTDSTVTKTVQCAQEGDNACQTLLGKWIFEGSHGYQKDYGKAVAWWMQAAKQNNNEATANLGFCYQYGWGVNADSATAVRLFEKALKLGNNKLVKVHDSLANNGSMFSAMLLAHCYKMAIGVQRNESAAKKYYQLAAQQGNVDATRKAAILMRSDKDDANALAMFKEAMQKGDVTSTYYYGKMLCEGRGTAKDMATGVSYLQKAADKDYAAAQYELAGAYAQGQGVAKDLSAAFHWYQKAAYGGNRNAWWQVAECHRLGHGTAIDYEEALECYAKASTEGYHNKIDALLCDENPEWKDTPFMHYLRGLRLLEIDGKADAALKEFAQLPKRMTLKQTMEALCMIHPSYSKQNTKKAVKQLQKSEAAGCRRATYELARMQINGELLEQDIEKAEKKLNKLAKEGYVRAINFLADSYYEGRVLKQEKTKAILLYLQAEQVGRLSSIGANRLSQASRNGEGMKVNEKHAEKLEKYRAYNVQSLLEKVRLR